MEKSIKEQNLTACIWDNLHLKEIDAKQLSPLVLAYIGDSIYDLMIRTYLLDKGNMQVNKINKHACALVKAETQSKLIGLLEERFTEEELAVYKRGRNAKSYTSAKNASIGDYRRATGFEALCGYLYLEGNFDRLTKLVCEGLVALGEEIA